MANTPVYNWPYPGTGDSPHGPNQVRDLALAIEPTVQALAATIAALLPATVENHQNASGNTGSTSYTATLAGGGVACGVAFVAPPSGKVTVVNTCELLNSGTGASLCCFVVRTGGSVGSGTVFLNASDDWARINTAGNSNGADRSKLVPGLTPGATYNVQQAFKVVSGTGTFLRKTILVRPEFA